LSDDDAASIERSSPLAKMEGSAAKHWSIEKSRVLLELIAELRRTVIKRVLNTLHNASQERRKNGRLQVTTIAEALAAAAGVAQSVPISVPPSDAAAAAAAAATASGADAKLGDECDAALTGRDGSRSRRRPPSSSFSHPGAGHPRQPPKLRRFSSRAPCRRTSSRPSTRLRWLICDLAVLKPTELLQAAGSDKRGGKSKPWRGRCQKTRAVLHRSITSGRGGVYLGVYSPVPLAMESIPSTILGRTVGDATYSARGVNII
jgi:hypothetical protein